MIDGDYYVAGSYQGLIDPKKKEAPIEQANVFLTKIKGVDAYLDPPSNVNNNFVDLPQIPLKRDDIQLSSLGSLASKSLNYTKDFSLKSDSFNRTK
jgi:hypothetical protein